MEKHGPKERRYCSVRCINSIAFIVVLPVTSSLLLLIKLQPANIVVERLLNHIVSREPGPQYFTAEPGMVGSRSACTPVSAIRGVCGTSQL